MDRLKALESQGLAGRELIETLISDDRGPPPKWVTITDGDFEITISILNTRSHVRYKCKHCKMTQWRGYFPKEIFHWKYVVFHGIAIGVCRIPAERVLNYFGCTMDSFVGGMLGLVIGLLLLFVYYGIGVIVELLIVLCFRCKSCRNRRLFPDW